MFDTMTLTKTVGGVCGALLVYMLGAWAAEVISHRGAAHGHDGEHAQAYTIPVEGAEEVSDEPVEEGPPLADLLAAADLGAGETLFQRQCAACHKLEAGENATGPYLYAVVGRPVQTAEGFGAYSGALIEHADVWTPENLDAFIANPKGFAPGTGMNYNGMRDAEDRANLIAYLDSIDG